MRNTQRRNQRRQPTDQNDRRKFDVDLDGFIYDQISNFDKYFENDTDWYDEEDTCEKDHLRDQVLELIGWWFDSR